MEKINLKFYIFDWDDNVLMMNTKIAMQRLVAGVWQNVLVNTHLYSEILPTLAEPHCAYRFPLDVNGAADLGQAFVKFSDTDEFTPNKAFLEDCIASIQAKQFGPSYAAFKECLLGGHLFMICTARGHNPGTIEAVVRFITDSFTPRERPTFLANIKAFHSLFKPAAATDSELMDWYLSNAMYMGVTSPYFKHQFGITLSPNDVAKGKSVAVQHFVERAKAICKKYPQLIERLSIGFSDDSVENLRVITDTLKALAVEHNIEYIVYDTSKNGNTHNYTKTKI